jgi:hypothetical protein
MYVFTWSSVMQQQTCTGSNHANVLARPVFGGLTKLVDTLKGQLLIQFANHVTCVLQVKAYISPERLLVYNVSEGWKLLCDFLHVEVPSTPFPKSNTMSEAETWTPIEKVDYVYVGLPIAAVIAGAVMALKRAHKH